VSSDTTVPRTVRMAGLIVVLQGIGGLGFALLLLINVIGGGATPGMNPVGEVVYFAVISAGVLACGLGLLLGKRWARGPATVIQLLLLGVAWYATGSSGRPALGLPLGVLCLVALVLMFRAPARTWAEGRPDDAPDDAGDSDSPGR
jgi:hypothetical protein